MRAADDGGPSRPAWMGAPPAEVYTFRRQRESGNHPSFTLVSVAIGAKFEGSLARLNQSAAAAGFDRTLLWREADMLQDPVALRYRTELQNLQKQHWRLKRRHPDNRPYCAAFKPLIMWRALMNARAGDVVHWTDSSQWHHVRLRPGVRAAAAALSSAPLGRARRSVPKPARGWARTRWFQRLNSSGSWPSHRLRNAYGLVSCSMANCEDDTFQANYRRTSINRETLRGFKELLDGDDKTILARPHLLNSNILLRNSAATRLLVWDWLQMAIAKPKAFCSSHTNDQAAWTLLVQNRSLPLINPCVYLGTVPADKRTWSCEQHYKQHNTFLTVIKEGLFEVYGGRGQSYNAVAEDLFGGFDKNGWVQGTKPF